jgi:hypothetical protein
MESLIILKRNPNYRFMAPFVHQLMGKGGDTGAGM